MVKAFLSNYLPAQLS